MRQSWDVNSRALKKIAGPRSEERELQLAYSLSQPRGRGNCHWLTRLVIRGMGNPPTSVSTDRTTLAPEKTDGQRNRGARVVTPPSIPALTSPAGEMETGGKMCSRCCPRLHSGLTWVAHLLWTCAIEQHGITAHSGGTHDPAQKSAKNFGLQIKTTVHIPSHFFLESTHRELHMLVGSLCCCWPAGHKCGLEKKLNENAVGVVHALCFD